MGRKDAAKIAMQLIEKSPNQTADTPVHILEAVSTSRERQWIGTLAELAAGKADTWFDSSSPALIVIGQALEPKTFQASLPELQSSDSEINDGLQDSRTLPYSRRRA